MVLSSLSIYVTKFDSKGNKTTFTSYSGSGELKFTTTYFYNQLGLLTGFETIKKNNFLLQKVTIGYDKNNAIIKSVDYNGETKLKDETTRAYKVKDGVMTEIRKRNGKHLDSTIEILNTDTQPLIK